MLDIPEHEAALPGRGLAYDDNLEEELGVGGLGHAGRAIIGGQVLIIGLNWWRKPILQGRF